MADYCLPSLLGLGNYFLQPVHPQLARWAITCRSDGLGGFPCGGQVTGD